MILDLYNRRLTLGEIFKGAWCVYTRHFLLMAVPVLLSTLVARVLQVLISSSFSVPAVKTVLAMGTNVITVIGSIAVIYVTAKAMSNEPVERTDCLQKIKEVFGSAVWVQIVYFVFLLLIVTPPFALVFYSPIEISKSAGFLLCGVSLIILLIISVYWLFYLQALIIRGKRGLDAFFYSWRLVRYQWWSVLGVTFLLGLPGALIVCLIHAVLRVSGLFDERLVMNGVEVCSSVIIMFAAIAGTIYFLNIDFLGIKGRMGEFKNPVDPVIPSEKNSHEMVS